MRGSRSSSLPARGSAETLTLAAPMKHRASFGLVAIFISLLFLVSMKIQFERLRMESSGRPSVASHNWRTRFGGLPRGIVEPVSDLEMKHLWEEDSGSKDNIQNHTALLAMAVGISQKRNVDIIVRKFLLGNFSIILFHYDGNVDGWHDLAWSNKAIHILAHNQTKWWFAKRFLHPDVVAMYDYVFLWDEDLGVENFHPGRYLRIMSSEGLEITQPALDPDNSTDIHHRITIRNQKSKVHRRVYDYRGSLNCSDESRGPPCTGWVEGMAPVFSRAAWRCVWHLIQNDLIHGWGLDMKIGYCAQGDRTKKVGVIDSEFIIHQGIPTLGRPSTKSFPLDDKIITVYCFDFFKHLTQPNQTRTRSLDLRTRIRRQSTAELKKFKERWNRAVKEDKEWIDPYVRLPKKKGW